MGRNIRMKEAALKLTRSRNIGIGTSTETADDRPDYIGWILYQDERLTAICALIVKKQRESKDEAVKGNGRRQS